MLIVNVLVKSEENYIIFFLFLGHRTKSHSLVGLGFSSSSPFPTLEVSEPLGNMSKRAWAKASLI